MDIKPPLTQGEKVYLTRRRLGLSQSKFAKKFGMSRNQISLIEREEVDPTPEMKISEVSIKSESELFAILRKRRGISQTDIGSALGLSRFWVNRMERGEVNDDKLRSYWLANAD